MAELTHLAYISKSAVNGSREDIQLQISNILEVAQRNNAAMGITGALLYSGGYFCQVIEGEEDKVSRKSCHDGVLYYIVVVKMGLAVQRRIEERYL